MEISVVPSPDVHHIRLTGEVIEPECRDLPDQVSRLMAESPRPVLIDFQEVSYINSAGLGACVATFKRAREADQEVALCGLSDDVLKIFKLTQLTAIFKLFPGPEDAVKSLQPK